MKKLTAGIFAGILGMVSMGAADANVASTGWVNQKLGTKADTSTVQTLQDTVGGLDEAVNKEGGIADTVLALKEAVYDAQGNPIDVEALQGDITKLEGAVYDAQGNPISVEDLKTRLVTVEGYIGDMQGYVSTEGLGTLTKAVNALDTRVETLAGGEISADKLGDGSVTVGKLGNDVKEAYVDTTELDGALANYYKTTETMTTQEITSAIDAAKLKNAGDETHAFYTDANGNAIKITKVAEAAKADSATTAGTADSAATATTATTATTAGTADLAKGYVEGEAIDLALKSKQAQLQAAGEAGKPVYINADGQPVAMNQVLDAAHADSATSADYATTAGTADTATTAAGYTADGAIATGLKSKVDIPSLTASDAAFGKYVLTADKTEAGATYYWEQIERAVVDGTEQF